MERTTTTMIPSPNQFISNITQHNNIIIRQQSQKRRQQRKEQQRRVETERQQAELQASGQRSSAWFEDEWKHDNCSYLRFREYMDE
jgi:hypothetical protein